MPIYTIHATINLAKIHSAPTAATYTDLNLLRVCVWPSLLMGFGPYVKRVLYTRTTVLDI